MPTLCPINIEELSNLSHWDKICALEIYHIWLAKERKNDKRELHNKDRKIWRMLNRDEYNKYIRKYNRNPEVKARRKLYLSAHPKKKLTNEQRLKYNQTHREKYHNDEEFRIKERTRKKLWNDEHKQKKVIIQ